MISLTGNEFSEKSLRPAQAGAPASSRLVSSHGARASRSHHGRAGGPRVDAAEVQPAPRGPYKKQEAA